MIPIVKVFMPPKDVLMPALEQVLYSGMVGEGKHVYTFEDKFKSSLGLIMLLLLVAVLRHYTWH